MAVKVDINHTVSVDSSKSADETFKYLSNLESNIPKDFPGIEKFEKTGGDVYQWTFEKLSYGGHDMQLKLATKIVPKGANGLELSPADSGAAQMSGGWKIDPQGDKSKVTFDVKLQLELPIPFFLKAMAAPIAQKELSKLFDRYMGNVAKALA